MAFAIMRSKKHKMGGGLKAALLHLNRERETPNADPSVTNLTRKSDGKQTTKDQLARLHGELDRVVESSGRKLRKDAVVAVEYVMTASPDWFSDDPEQRRKQAIELANRSRKWIAETYPEGKVIAARIHMDETTPHLSLFVTPTVKKGDRLSLSAREFLGGREKLQAQQDSFADIMRPLGLDRGVRNSKASHESVNRFYGRLKSFEGIASLNEEPYLAKIDNSKSYDELLSVAKGMANELGELQRSYQLHLGKQNTSLAVEKIEGLEEKIEDLEGKLSDLGFENMKAEYHLDALYGGINDAKKWAESLDTEERKVISKFLDVQDYETALLKHEMGLIDELPEDPRKKITRTLNR